MSRRTIMLVLLIVGAAFVLSGCAAGTARFSVDEPAGFWAGLWHGFIIIITFIWGLFSDTVRMYEPRNIGNLYDLGFILGAMLSLGGMCGSSRRKKKAPCVTISSDIDDTDWGEVETRVKRGIRSWLDETEGTEGDWGKVAADVEERIKRELREWSKK